MTIKSVCHTSLSGTKTWRAKDLGNSRHRGSGPAVIYKDGTQMWYKFGKLHRLDGPAVEWSNGGRQWFIDGVLYDPIVWMLKLHEMKIK